MTTVSERRIIREIDDDCKNNVANVPPGGSPISGILKGGRLWKQTSFDSSNMNRNNDNQQVLFYSTRRIFRINYEICLTLYDIDTPVIYEAYFDIRNSL